MHKNSFSRRSAYGQLIILVFLPISFLAAVGAFLVYFETMNANKHEQQGLAKAILIRYQPIIQNKLPQILTQNNQTQSISNSIDVHEHTTMKKRTEQHVNNELQHLLFSVETENELQRVAIIDSKGKVLASAGFKIMEPWEIPQNILISDTPDYLASHQAGSQSNNYFINGIENSVGTAYGTDLGELHGSESGQQLWLFVDMDNQPLKLAQYRIAFALVATGMLTLLLLLLALNIYSRRWIEPIYQIRLYLQRITFETLDQSFELKSEGEIHQLKTDLLLTFQRLSHSYQELKEYSEQTQGDLQQAFDEMEMQNINMRNSRDKAVSTSEAKSAFLANISHELRTPLNSIDGFINLLARRGELSFEQDLYVQTIRKSSAHLLALVNDVLDFSKMEAGKLVLDSHEFELYTAIYDVVDMLSPVANEKGLRMAVLIYNDVPLSIIGDALRMKQVLTNLVANAIKFTDTGDVLVKVCLDEHSENHLTIIIQDSGRGVSTQEQQQLFKSFSQGDPSITRQYGGTGLGLVISQELTQLMGGKIGYYDNAQGNISSHGSTFWFSMPTHIDVLEVENAGDIELPALKKPVQNLNTLQSTEADLLNADSPLQLLVWINHPASIQLLNASLQFLNVQITQTNSLASILDKLEEQGNYWDWVIVDSGLSILSTSTSEGKSQYDSQYNNQNGSQYGNQDDMTALLKQIRLHYQGRLAVYGYQVALNTKLLARYKAYALHEPMDKRQLYAMLDHRINKKNKVLTDTLRWQGYRVLAVDDHFPNLLVLDALLAEQGIEVVTANSGFDAIEIISKQSGKEADSKPIDLIFMDIQMPRMSGHEASKQIRNIDKRRPRIPIIALTAQGMADERDKLMQSGIDDYVGKPISQPQLLQILQKWLGRKPESSNIHNNQNSKSSNQIHDSGAKKITNSTTVPQTIDKPIIYKASRYQFASSKARERYSNQAQETIFRLSNLYKKNNELKNRKGVMVGRYWQFEESLTKQTHHKSIQNTELAIIDWDDALERSANKPSLASQLIIMMIDSVPDEKQALQTAWSTLNEESDIEPLLQISHRIVGASRYTGVPEVRATSQVVEALCLQCKQFHIEHRSTIDITTLQLPYNALLRALDNLANADLSPWSQLRYHRLEEDEMNWKMI